MRASRRNNDTSWGAPDGDFDYLADDAEAVVFLTAELSGFMGYLYVMRRFEAQLFCSQPGTSGRARHRRPGAPVSHWMYCWTTHVRNWRDLHKSFLRDDGRFDALFAALGITPIYIGGRPWAFDAPQAAPVKAPQPRILQLSLF